jgi:hypothetical protein
LGYGWQRNRLTSCKSSLEWVRVLILLQLSSIWSSLVAVAVAVNSAMVVEVQAVIGLVHRLLWLEL